ncbi:hypothetical protein Gasu2_51780 [Galdieria sulphuraria]|uniref:DNA photolyase / blue-light receptor 2 n=1 Tax=Galdieria sulphuraria TaxID=130081 RepID=M2VUU2_GALSU|nr:DNA photolyase / blue-light receptor 2 [Galdieria sulphuraria]EME26966.1 DNA photolyase / blue-light receptor 2 [Galdieria sulphuraria]GJD11020.1 hypothetical protein Gasu2_51780 [Galdieria sulphuraria]|eukprot:XP_005703486.1 DNA photolyase / blue-light receptor 2 [Galdieria sulphuraria]
MVSMSFVIDEHRLQTCLQKSTHRKYEEKVFCLRFMQIKCSIPRSLPSFSMESGRTWMQFERPRNSLQLGLSNACGNKGDIAIVWLRRELRLHDNIALVEAVKSYRRILPLFIHESVSMTHQKRKDEDRGSCLLSEDLLYEDLSQEHDLLEMCLKDLRKQFRQLGSDLLVIVSNNAVESLLELIRSTRAQGLYFYNSIFAKERKQELELKQRLDSNTSVNIYTFWTNTLHPFDKLISKSTLHLEDCDQFGQYIHNWEVPKDIPSPEYLKPFPYDRLDDSKYKLDFDIISSCNQELKQKSHVLAVSEREALSRLTEFVSSQTCGWIQHYPDEAMIDTKYGRMNPYLSLGCISMRTIFRRVVDNIPHSLRRYCVEMDLIFREFLMFRYFQTSNLEFVS